MFIFFNAGFKNILNSSQKGLDKDPEWMHSMIKEKVWASLLEVLSHFLQPTTWGIWGKSPNLTEPVSSYLKWSCSSQSDWEELKVVIQVTDLHHL